MCLNLLPFFVDNIFVRYGDTFYRQVIRIPISTNCAPLVAIFFFCHETAFMLSLDKQSQVDVISAFNDTSRYLMIF